MSAILEAQRQEKDQFFKSHPHSPIPRQERANFQGLPYFPPNPALDLQLTLEAFDQKEAIQMQTSAGDLREYLRWGKVYFEVDGQQAHLTLYYSPDMDHFFLPFMDATSGQETYGAGRYLDPHPHEDGTLHLDFNLAYSPYCAYNPNYSCPIPPQENRLTVRIEAGEKTWNPKG
jgi:hypothetical protein